MAEFDKQRAQVSDLRKRWQRHRDDRQRAERIARMARGDWGDDIPRMPQEPDWHALKAIRPRFAPNLVGAALQSLDTLYSEEPHRTVNDEAEEWARRRLWDFGIGLSAAMSRADRLARLHGIALLYPAYKAGEDAARWVQAAASGEGIPEAAMGDGEDGVEVIALGRPDFELLPNSLDARHAEAIVIRMGSLKRDSGYEAPIAHYWDRTHFALLHDWEPQPLGEDGAPFLEHGMPDHPLVIYRNDPADLSTYGFGWDEGDVRQSLLQIGKLWREYGWTAMLQRGQPYVRGEAENLILAPDAFIQVEAQGEVGMVGNGANLAGMLAAIQAHTDVLARSLGLPSTTFAVGQARSGMSGIAIALDRAELQDDRNARKKIAASRERAITRKAALLYETVTGESVPLTEVGVSYRPLPMVLSAADRRERIKLLADLGWIAPEDAVAELYPDLSTDEVEARVERALAANGAAGPGEDDGFLSLLQPGTNAP